MRSRPGNNLLLRKAIAMKHRFRSLPLFLVAVLCAAAAMGLVRTGPGSEPLLLSSAGRCEDTAEAFFDTLCAGDYESASSYCRNGLPREEPPAEEDAAALYALLRESWSWEAAGEAEQSGIHARIPVRFTALSPEALCADLKGDVNALLSRYVEEAALSSDIYDEAGQYRESVVMRAWDEAFSARLSRAAEFTETRELSVELVYEGGRWQIVPSSELLAAMAGA